MRFYEILDLLTSYHPQADRTLLERAYAYSAKLHQFAVRPSDEYYLEHPLEVAAIVAQLHLDERSVAAGMLHDVLEEELLSVAELEALFEPQLVDIIKGITRLSRLEYEGNRNEQVEYLRKMILAMTRDLRVILVKLADCLHDMRSFSRRPEPRTKQIASKVLDIYAPIAGRLGIEWVKIELEDLAFRSLHPREYQRIAQGLAKTEEERNAYIAEVKAILDGRLKENGLQARVSGRSKHFYSIYRKMMSQNLELDRIYDLIAFRIIVDSIDSCYKALAIVHALWEPVPGRYKDYITKPKPNLYRSLHTTVLGPYGEPIEVQIRTEEMDRVAREGIAAHWLYKESSDHKRALEGVDRQEVQRFSWLRQLLEPERGWRNPREFFDSVRVDLYPDEVFVFSPRGEIKVLPKGATPVDFAYHIHSEVGHRCVGARVNGKIVPLNYELKTGDTVEILTATKHRPSKDWLKFVKTSKARSRIRHWIKMEEREASISLGRELCEREFRKRGLNFNHYINSPELLEVAKGFSLQSIDELLASVGYKKVSAAQVVGRILGSLPEEQGKEEEIVISRKHRSGRDEGVLVQGAGDVLVRMAKCCNPVPGEPIVGYITRGRGITVHRQCCRNICREKPERQIEVQWDTGEDQSYPVTIRVLYDKALGNFRVLSSVLGHLDAEISGFKPLTEPQDGLHFCELQVEVRDAEHLRRVLRALEGERSIHRVQRVSE